MRLVHKIERRFPTGPDTVLDMPLDSGFMSGVSVQDKSQANNHGVAIGDAALPIPQYPGFLFTASDNQSIGASVDLSGGTYPFTMAVFVKSVDQIERAVFALGDPSTDTHQTLKSHPTETYGSSGKFEASVDTSLASRYSNILDQWTCLVATYAGVGGSGAGNWLVYINGIEDSNPPVDNSTNPVANLIRWKIGDSANNGSTESPWDGVIGDVIFERRVWSAAEAKNYFEINKHKYVNFGPVGDAAKIAEIVGRWRLNEDTGTSAPDSILDSSGNAFHGTPAKAVTSVVALDGLGQAFDGAQWIVDTAEPLVKHPCAMSVWVRIASGVTGTLFSLSKENSTNAPTDKYLELNVLLGVPRMSMKGADAIRHVAPIPALSNDIWHQLVGVWFEVNDRKLYVDGAEVAVSGAISGAFPVGLDTITMGARSSRSSVVEKLTGDLSDAKIYTGIPTTDEIAQWFIDGIS